MIILLDEISKVHKNTLKISWGSTNGVENWRLNAN